MRFLSALAWVEGGGASVEYITGGNLPRPVGRLKEHGYILRDDFDLSYLPEPDDENALLAMALLREAGALITPAMHFFRHIGCLKSQFPKPKSRWNGSMKTWKN